MSALFKSRSSYFVVILEKFTWFLVFHVIFSVFILRKWNFAVILSDKWEVKNKVLILLHYSFWRRGSIFQKFWIVSVFFSKSHHCQCPKITFKLLFSILLHNGSSHQHSIIGKKLNEIWCHNITWWRQHLFKVI